MERMDPWGAVTDIAGWVVVGALLVVLAWAAIERGRIHRVPTPQRGLRKDAAALLACGSMGSDLSCGGGAGAVTSLSIPNVPKGD